MAKKHLSEDEIKYIVSTETSSAQKEIYELSKATKKLGKEERDRKRAMIELEAQGKKNSVEYKNLEKEVKAYSKQISDNNKKIAESTKKLDVNEMSMSQLRKQAKHLRSEMDNMSASLNPKQYAELEKQLGRVEGRMNGLRATGRRVGSQFEGNTNIVKKLTLAVKTFVALKLVQWFTQVHNKAYETRKEFAKFEAVLGNALQSQEAATKAMAQLQKMASDTPYSLQVWTEGYIRLVNRGLKPTTSEMTKLGDLTASQGKGVDQLIEATIDAMAGENIRLREFGIVARKNGETTKFTFRGVTTEVRNTESAIKDYIMSLGELDGVQGSMAVQMKELEGLQSNLGDAMDAMWNRIGKKFESTWKSMLTSAIAFVSDFTKTMEPLSETFEKQLDKVVDLEREIPVMISRYEELAKKTNRNIDEQKELNSLMNKIVSIVPEAVSEFDKYGNILSVNTNKVYEYLAAEKARLKFVHREEIKNLKELQAAKEKELESLIALDKKREYWSGVKGVISSNESGMRQRSTAKIDENNKKIAALGAELLGIETQLSRISGESAQKLVDDRIDAQQAEIDARNNFNAMNKQQLNAWLQDEQNAASKYKEIAKEIYDKRFPEEDEDAAKKRAAKALTRAEKEARARIDTEKAALKSVEDLRQDDLNALQQYYNKSVAALNDAQAMGTITKEQHQVMMLELDKQNADNRLRVEQTYYDDLQSMVVENEATKEDAIRKSYQRVIDAEKTANMARISQQRMMTDLMKDFKSQFKITTVDEDYRAQLAVLEASYQARREMAVKNNLETVELDKAYLLAKEQLEQEHEGKLMAIRNQYGLTTQQERFDAELEQLINARAQQLLTEEEYEQAVQNLKRDSYKQQFDYFSSLFSGAVNALRQAEMDNVDAKYDAEIEAAKGNAEEVERLENEKAQKKLDIEKKYADVNFAIKASQIIADTSVSIMKAIADLGPIVGPIYASLIGITGAAQLASAAAERRKVKNMKLSGASSSSGTGARIATGRESGGKIDVQRAQDGKLFKGASYDPSARGYIDRPTVIVGEGGYGRSKEWVASNAAVSNPTVAPILDILDQAQQAGNIRTLDLGNVIRTRMAGYAGGGSINRAAESAHISVPPAPISSGVSDSVIEKLTDAIDYLTENGVPATVSLTDFERKQQLRDKARNKAKKRMK